MNVETSKSPSEDDLLHWVEKLAFQLAEVGGLPLIAGRIMGWLMVSEPPEQTAEEIGTRIGASRASLSTNLRLLVSLKLISVISRPGRRTRYYRMEEDAWETVMRMQIAALAPITATANEGIALFGGQSGRTRRLRAARDVFAWMQRVFDDAPPPPPPSENKDP